MSLIEVEEPAHEGAPLADAPRFYLIWSNEHGLWWRPGGYGYTRAPMQAGLFPETEAIRICLNAMPLEDGRPAECMVPADWLLGLGAHAKEIGGNGGK